MAIDEETRKPPVWLDCEFLTKALQKGLKEPFLKINGLEIKPATAVGENYASLVFRAVFMVARMPTMKEERMSIVIKTMPKGELIQDLAKIAFEREAKMLLTVLPEINKRLKDVYPDHKPLSARCYWYTNDPEPVLILEDLKELGFGLADRMSGLDSTTTNMVLDSLAKYHAASLAVAEDQPQKLQGVVENLWAENEDIATLSKCGLEGLIEEVSEWEDCPKEYVQKLINLRPVIVQRMRESLKLDESFLNVLLHGDCWINNMMVYSDKNAAKMMRFVDFQMCLKNSASIDLNYFIFTSPNSSIRLKTDEMLKMYYTTFMETVKKLGIRLSRDFTFDDLKNDFRKRSFFGLIAAIVIYPITVTEKKDVVEVNDLFDETTSKRKTYQNETFKNMFKLIMPYFIDCGAL